MKNKKNTTLVYITLNIEEDKLENKIRKQIRQNSGDLPIVSVSRKPIKFGKNICVGAKPVCRSSALKMLLKGLLAADTKYVIIAEADCLYPPEYFSFTPPTNNMAYLYGNVWTLGDRYWKKRSLDGAMACNREYWIKMISTALEDQIGWQEFAVPPIFDVVDHLTWNPTNPVVRLITPNTPYKYSNLFRRIRPQKVLPYWGLGADLKTRMGV